MFDIYYAVSYEIRTLHLSDTTSGQTKTELCLRGSLRGCKHPSNYIRGEGCSIHTLFLKRGGFFQLLD